VRTNQSLKRHRLGSIATPGWHGILLLRYQAAHRRQTRTLGPPDHFLPGFAIGLARTRTPGSMKNDIEKARQLLLFQIADMRVLVTGLPATADCKLSSEDVVKISNLFAEIEEVIKQAHLVRYGHLKLVR
jgi:hypothetical protein